MMYSIIRNDAGELMLLLPDGGHRPEMPFLLCDGSCSALLLKSLFEAVALRHIEPRCSEALSEADEIHVVETNEKDLVRDYIAPVKRVPDVEAFIEELA